MSADAMRSRPGAVRTWVLAARPATLTAAVVPVLAGTAAAVHDGHFRLLPFLAAMLAATLIQIGTNLANDVFDYERGADTSERLGPPRVTQTGLASPRSVRLAMAATFGAAALVGLYLVAVGGVPILVIGVLSIVSGVIYTGGPWPIGYHGLGDLFVFVFFGLVATGGSYYLQASDVGALAGWTAVMVGCTVTAILVVNNLRDIATDRLSGKHTLAVVLGDRWTRIEYAALMLAPYGLAAVLILVGALPWWSWITWLSLPLAGSLVRAVVAGAAGPALNVALKRTARLHLLLGALLALSLLP